MDEKIDHGPVTAVEKLKIKNEKYKDLENKLARFGAKLLVDILPKLIDGKIKPKEQIHNEATFTKKFSWPDGKIDWSKSAKDLEHQIRALNPEPGVWTLWGNKTLKIFDAEIIESKLSAKPGQVFNIENQIIVKCGIDALILKKIQLEGRKELNIQNFIHGHREFIGSKLT